MELGDVLSAGHLTPGLPPHSASQHATANRTTYARSGRTGRQIVRTSAREHFELRRAVCDASRCDTRTRQVRMVQQIRSTKMHVSMRSLLAVAILATGGAYTAVFADDMVSFATVCYSVGLRTMVLIDVMDNSK